MGSDSSKSFVKGTVILIAGNIIVKIIGAFFKLPLGNIIGADGLGLYNASFNVYDIFLVVASAGYTLAISKMVAKCFATGNDGEALKILQITKKLFLIIGLSLSVIMFLGGRFFAGIIGNRRSYYCIIVLAPAVLFVSLMCSYRGYYQGTNDMVPTTISQVTESIVRLITGLSLSYWLKKQGYDNQIVAAGAIAGITLGELTSTSTLALIHRIKTHGKKPRKRSTSSTGRILKSLFATSIPIGISGIIISILNMADNAVVMRRLQEIGCTEKTANTMYGALNMAFTVFGLPITVVAAISVSVFPVLSYANACKNYQRVSKVSEAALRLAVLVSTAAAALFMSLSQPLINILYFRQPQDAAVAAPLLLLLAPGAVVLSLSMLTSMMLQATDRLLAPSKSLIIGGAVCLGVNWVLVGMPDIGIYGTPIGMFICYLISTMLNISALRKGKKVRVAYRKMFFKPILPAAVMALTGAFAFHVLAPTLGSVRGAMAALLFGFANYLFVMCATGGIQMADLQMLPKGDKIVALLQFFHILPKSRGVRMKSTAFHKGNFGGRRRY